MLFWSINNLYTTVGLPRTLWLRRLSNGHFLFGHCRYSYITVQRQKCQLLSLRLLLRDLLDVVALVSFDPRTMSPEHPVLEKVAGIRWPKATAKTTKPPSPSFATSRPSLLCRNQILFAYWSCCIVIVERVVNPKWNNEMRWINVNSDVCKTKKPNTVVRLRGRKQLAVEADILLVFSITTRVVIALTTFRV